jgi:hypothetical protein
VLLLDYLEASGHAREKDGALFHPIRNNRTGTIDRSLCADGVYKIMRSYSLDFGWQSAQLDSGTLDTQ